MKLVTNKSEIVTAAIILAIALATVAHDASAWNAYDYGTRSYDITPTTPWGTPDYTSQRGGYRIEQRNRGYLGTETTIVPTTPWGTPDYTGRYGNSGYTIRSR